MKTIRFLIVLLALCELGTGCGKKTCKAKAEKCDVKTAEQPKSEAVAKP